MGGRLETFASHRSASPSEMEALDPLEHFLMVLCGVSIADSPFRSFSTL
jgi:hypothetical protein